MTSHASKAGTRAAREYLTLSFSGAGHLLPYHLGVSWSLLQHMHQNEVTKRMSSKIEKQRNTTNRKNSSTILDHHLLGNNSSLLSSSSSLSSSPSSSDPPPILPPIKAVGGSSSGAIAAVIFSKIPHRLEEYAERFIETRGKAFETLSSMLHDEEIHWTSESNGMSNTTNSTSNSNSEYVNYNDNDKNNHGISKVSIEQRIKVPPTLYIATTKCNNGSPYLFKFSNNHMFSTISSSWNTDSILQAVKASCTIPPSFHPVDILSNKGMFSISNDTLYYPNEEGIHIGGEYYVDGGIASPAPIIPTVNRNASRSIIVSPISFGRQGGSSNGDDHFMLKNGNEDDDDDDDNNDNNVVYRMSPSDNSWRLLPFCNIKCRNDFLVKPSIQNVRALRVAGGMASSIELREWFDRGIDDANKMIDEWK